MLAAIIPVEITPARLTSSTIDEDDAPAWAVGTTYALDDEVIDEHQVWRSLRASNVGHTPSGSPTWWVNIGATNRWRMFDPSITTQSTRTSSITVVLSLPAINAITLMGVVATNITVSGTAVSVNQAIPAPVAPAIDVAVRLDGLGFAGGALTIGLTGPGAVKVAAVAIGALVEIGDVQYGYAIEIIDNSTRNVDEFGNLVSVTHRGTTRRISGNAEIPASTDDAVAASLTALRARVSTWRIDEDVEAAQLFGYLMDWELVLSMPTKSVYRFVVEGVTQREPSLTLNLPFPPEPEMVTLSLAHFDTAGLPDSVPTNTVDLSSSEHILTSSGVFNGSAVTAAAYPVYSGGSGDGRLITGPTGLTLEAWVLPNSMAPPTEFGTRFNLVKLDKATASQQILVQLTWTTAFSGVTTFSAECSATTDYTNYTGFYIDSVWTDFTLKHFALVVTPSSYSLYVNGTRTNTGTFDDTYYPDALTWAADAFFIIRNSSTSTAYRTDEARLSNVARYSGASFTVPTAPFALD